MKIAILHPDLGLGGAERLIVDVAVALQAKVWNEGWGKGVSFDLCLLSQGHEVHMYTSHYDPARCFEEAKPGNFPITVYGDWMPRHIFGKLHIVFALARNSYAAWRIALSREKYDVFITDQVKTHIHSQPQTPV